MKKILLLNITLLSSIYMSSQDFTLYTMSYMQQRNSLNPAFVPKSKIQIGFPALSSINFSLGNSGFKYSDVFYPQGDSLVADFGNLVDKLKEKNYLTTNINVELFSFGFKLGDKNYIRAAATEKGFIQLQYPQGFFKFLYEGNGPSAGTPLSFNFGLNAIHYREYAINYSREVTPALRAGIAAKYLYGMENINTKRSDITMQTNADSAYDITLSSDILVNASGLSNSDSVNQSYFAGKKNTGFAFDLGLTYVATEKITLAASVLNLGSIAWKSDVQNYASSNPNSEYTYKGLPLKTFFEGDSAFETATKTLADSVKKLFNLDSTNNSYKTNLPVEFHVSGDFEIIKGQHAGAHVMIRSYDKVITPAVSLYYASDLGRWLTTSVTYSIYNNSYTNLGFGLRLNGGPFQFHVMTDNVFALAFPQHGKYVHVRTGINFTFGNKPKSEAAKSDAK